MIQKFYNNDIYEAAYLCWLAESKTRKFLKKRDVIHNYLIFNQDLHLEEKIYEAYRKLTIEKPIPYEKEVYDSAYLCYIARSKVKVFLKKEELITNYLVFNKQLHLSEKINATCRKLIEVIR